MRFEARVEGATTLADKVLVAISEMPRDLEETKVKVGTEAVTIYRGYAPKRTLALVRDLQARLQADEVIVSTDPVNQGFHYVSVTRFGHKKAIIKPIHERRQASVIATRRRRSRPKSPRKGTKPALAILTANGFIFRYKVKGYHPTTDWAEDALPEIEAVAGKLLPQVGNRFLDRTGE